MRKNWIGTVVLIGTSLAAGFLVSPMEEQVQGEPAAVPVAQPQVVVNQPAELPKCFVDFVTLPSPGGSPSSIRVITFVDTEAKRIAVYHEDMATGGVRLLSVRDIQPDLMLGAYNATSPLPSEIMQELKRVQGQK